MKISPYKISFLKLFKIVLKISFKKKNVKKKITLQNVFF